MVAGRRIWPATWGCGRRGFARVGGVPMFGCGVALGEEAPGGLPDVLDDVDEVERRPMTGAPALAGLDAADLMVVAVDERDPGPGAGGVAALGLVEDAPTTVAASSAMLAVSHLLAAAGPAAGC